ncbi:MAG: VOC family protein [Candidatus Acidiferrales bacterium]
MAKAVKAIPEGYQTITPSITCRDAAKAIDFYKKAFGAQEIMRMGSPDGKIMHAELQLGNSRFMLNDEMPGMAAAPNPTATTSCSLFVYVSDVDSVFKQAVSAGAKVEMPVQDMFWGDRYGKVTDPFGHHWGLATHVEDVAPDEMERRSKAFMAKAAS